MKTPTNGQQGALVAGVYWRAPDLAMLDELQRSESSLPSDAPAP
ncbi:hypothetical protein [Streptomyces zhihengii]